MIVNKYNIQPMDSLYEAVKRKLNLTGTDWEKMVKLMNDHPLVKQMTGYPREIDVAKVKSFARAA